VICLLADQCGEDCAEINVYIVTVPTLCLINKDYVVKKSFENEKKLWKSYIWHRFGYISIIFSPGSCSVVKYSLLILYKHINWPLNRRQNNVLAKRADKKDERWNFLGDMIVLHVHTHLLPQKLSSLTSYEKSSQREFGAKSHLQRRVKVSRLAERNRRPRSKFGQAYQFYGPWDKADGARLSGSHPAAGQKSIKLPLFTFFPLIQSGWNSVYPHKYLCWRGLPTFPALSWGRPNFAGAREPLCGTVCVFYGVELPVLP